MFFYLVVSTPLKNISQIGSFPQIGVKKCLKPSPSFVSLNIYILEIGKYHLGNGKIIFHNTKSEEHLGWWDEEIYPGSIPVIPPVRFGVWMVCFRGPVIPPNSFGVWKPNRAVHPPSISKKSTKTQLSTKQKK